MILVRSFSVYGLSKNSFRAWLATAFALQGENFDLGLSVVCAMTELRIGDPTEDYGAVVHNLVCWDFSRCPSADEVSRGGDLGLHSCFNKQEATP